jgi:hypothetical protein
MSLLMSAKSGDDVTRAMELSTSVVVQQHTHSYSRVDRATTTDNKVK